MKYSKETIELLASHPHKHFAMSQIVRHINCRADKKQKLTIRVGVLRVLKALIDNGSVQVISDDGIPRNTKYKWFKH